MKRVLIDDWLIPSMLPDIYISLTLNNLSDEQRYDEGEGHWCSVAVYSLESDEHLPRIMNVYKG